MFFIKVAERNTDPYGETEMTYETPSFLAKRVQAFVPIWNLTVDGVFIGSMTDFAAEGPTATVTLGAEKITVCGGNLRVCLACAKEAYLLLQYHASGYEEEYIEDEDGEIARMRWEECRYCDENPEGDNWF